MAEIAPRTPILVGGGSSSRSARHAKERSREPAIRSRCWRKSRAAPSPTRARRTSRLRSTRSASCASPRTRRAIRADCPSACSAIRRTASRTGSAPSRDACSTRATGGNTPQWLVNRTAEEIANGECDVALLAGAEYIASMLGAMKQGVDLGWGKGADGDPGDDPVEIGERGRARATMSAATASRFPSTSIRCSRTACAARSDRTPAEHLKWLGKFFSPFTKVASENPNSWFPTYRSPQEISTPSEKNRFVGFPYTKYLNAVIEVDMAAAVVMTSVAKARELGIPRIEMGVPAWLRRCQRHLERQRAGELSFLARDPHDRPRRRSPWPTSASAICPSSISIPAFPSAVEIGCQELGIATDDPRGLTITGGLPYFGGPGNNYVMHSIVQMIGQAARERRASSACAPAMAGT